MRRFALLAAAAVVLLAVAGLASATPRLIISGTTVQILEDKTDAAPLKTTIYVPAGYTATLGQAAGSQIGTVHADLQALAISPDAIIQADGAVLVAPDPNASTLTTAATQCTGTTSHAATWLLHVTVSGTTLDVPVWVDPTAGAAQALGVATLTFCLPDPYIPQSAGGAAFGSKIINAAMKLNSGIVSGSGGLWRSIITPWNTTTPAPDAAHTIEAQSIDAGAATATLKAKKGAKGKVTLSGTVKRGGNPVSGAAVTLNANGKKQATATTNASGAWTKAVTIKKTTKFQAKATIAQQDGACVSPLPTSQVPGGCLQATTAGATASSSVVTVKK
jgi:hypothetical protein